MSVKRVVMFAAPAVSAYMLLYGPDGPPPPSPKPSVLDSACYNDTWPVVSNCVKWWSNGTHRYVEGNSIPDHDEHGNRDATLGPYCPFGKDDPRGYCLPAEGDQCPFKDLICPAQESAKSLELDGDVPVSFQIWAEFPLNPDPTADDLPKHLYSGATQYQQIGVHLNGVHIKGPGEAEGYNVDTSRIPLLCGGHVTPPIGAGPVYHYHKASTCDHIEVVGQHGPLIGFANDGFAIYGFQDIDGTAPVVDECNGHFGPVSNERLEEVTYHYHAHETSVVPSLTFEKQEPSFQPYFLGCQGPSKMKCNTTVTQSTDLGHNWCGVGCGSELCVQPGTTNSSIESYLSSFGKDLTWFDTFTVNDYTICPECYRQGPPPPSRKFTQELLFRAQMCKICTQGVCKRCQGCAKDDASARCQGCTSGGCTLGCDDCWSARVV